MIKCDNISRENSTLDCTVSILRDKLDTKASRYTGQFINLLKLLFILKYRGRKKSYPAQNQIRSA